MLIKSWADSITYSVLAVLSKLLHNKYTFKGNTFHVHFCLPYCSKVVGSSSCSPPEFPFIDHFSLGYSCSHFSNAFLKSALPLSELPCLFGHCGFPFRIYLLSWSIPSINECTFPKICFHYLIVIFLVYRMMIKFSLVLFLSPLLSSFLRLKHVQTHYDGGLDENTMVTQKLYLL